MKKFNVTFIKILLLLLLIVLGLFIPLLSNFSKEVANIEPTFSYMRIPMLILCVSVVLSAMSAIGFGLLALRKYGSGEVFKLKTVRYLQGSSLSFFVGVLIQILIIIYTEINVSGSITNLYVLFGVIIFSLGNQIFKLIADVVSKGIEIKVDNDLTI
ncbi:Protein of unknown function [Anaerosphaera aminiphila DSM 21120]|uniref:DUF2975 domain-containing protein n=1 Tax=Anaerosphaera aminiphila DSM 21120 TaxID=1120995 RepID=A0A1M5ULZ7_9FIRM|nr:DUF2975 domain-containing protein [Anaerosphaera aminiphila]SHH64042.1 Protein of unknown function [Anaerosphaera aminiphila DSM 21120]